MEEIIEGFTKHGDGTITLINEGERYHEKLIPDVRCPGEECRSSLVIDISDRDFIINGIKMEAFCWDCSWMGIKEDLHRGV